MTEQGRNETAKPNILFIFTDQHRGDALGSLPGSPVISPNLDRLAAEGITFTRCISNSPLCVPARASIMTGQLPREHGAWSNRIGADEHGPSHVRNIRDAGYCTGVIGKTHLWRHGPGGKPGVHVKEMEANLEAWGFEHRHEVNDPIETIWMDCHYSDYLASKGWLEDHRAYVKAWFSEMRRGNETPWGQPPSPAPPGEDIDSYIGRCAVDWLRDYSRDDPFYLQVQFTGPHDPFDAPQIYRDRYDPSELDPGIKTHPEPPLTRTVKHRLEHSLAVARATTMQRQRWRAGYYANVTLIDDCIGRILDALERKGQLDNTWIIFASDHGELLGDRGLWGKAVFYDEAIRVPCILRAPGGGGGWRSAATVEQIDLPATMIDIAGAKPLENTLGRSLLPYVGMRADDPAASQGKKAVVSELFGESTIITDEYKLTVRIENDAPSQLMDLRNDPQELRNVVDDDGYADVVASLIAEHLEPLRERTDEAKLADYRDYVRRTGSVN